MLQLSGVGLLLAAVVTLGLSVGAGATGPTSGSIVSSAAQPQSPFTAGIPFSSGQSINLVIPANSALAAPANTNPVNVVECAAPNGVVPTQTAACDSNTIQGGSITPNSDGSFTYTGYPVYALPDSVTLLEGSGGPNCGQTAATECILYIGTNQLDFTQPHLWSAPFFIGPDVSDAGTNPGDGSPPAVATVPSATLSTAVASPTSATADGVDLSTVTVTLLGTGGIPAQGKAVSLASPSTAAKMSGPSPAVTDAHGQTTFTVTDTIAESVTLTAVDTTDGITLASMPTVTFATSPPSATASIVLASATTSPADGTTQTLITVTVNDQFGNPLPGKTVTIQGAPAGNVDMHAVAVGGSSSTPPGVTNGSGIAEFDVSDSHAEMVTFTATDTTDNMVLAPKVSITYLPGPVDPAGQGTTITVAPADLPADGSTPSTITVTLTDAFSNPVSGKTIALKAVKGNSLITAVNPVTNETGQATFTVSDATAEIVTYQATDVTDGNAVLAAEGVVTFGNPSAPPPAATSCSVVASPTSVPADGTHTATISVLLRDGKGDPVTGKTVTLAESGGAPKVTATNATSDNNGAANFAVSDSTAETVKFMADDTSDSIDLTAIPVTVTFTAAATTSTTTTTSTTSTTSTTTTTTTSASATTTTTGAAAANSLGATSTGSSTGNAGTPSLAATGPSWLLPWLIGFGALFLGAGTIGRRRFNGERKEA